MNPRKTGRGSGPGLLELSPAGLEGYLRSEPIRDLYFVEREPFARGKFASVRKIRHLATGVEYAAKFIRKRRRAQDTTDQIYHEIAVLALCGESPRLVRLHEVYETRSEMVLVLELAAGGELQRILDDGDQLSEGDARRAMRQILEGLAYLHSHRVAHLDLKPQNLLLTADLPLGDVKLCDFGISRVIEPGVELREILGTPDYVAPEILNYEPISLATDIWSAGVLAYVLLSGCSPFSGDTKQETFFNISQCALAFPPEDFPDVSDEAFDFIRAALVLDPGKRMTVQECLQHPWLRESAGPSASPRSLGALPAPPPDGCGPEREPPPPPLKHPHRDESARELLEPDAPPTPKMIRKSVPESPASVLGRCKVYGSLHASGMFGFDRAKGRPGRVVLEAREIFEGPSALAEGVPFAPRNPRASKGGAPDARPDAAPGEPAYAECLQCEVQSCNLASSHKRAQSAISHIDRAILC